MSDTPLSTTQRWRAHTERQAQGLSPKGRRGGGARAATTPRGRRRRPPRHAPQRLPNDTWGTAGGDQRTQLGRAAAIVVGHGSWGGGGGDDAGATACVYDAQVRGRAGRYGRGLSTSAPMVGVLGEGVGVIPTKHHPVESVVFRAEFSVTNLGSTRNEVWNLGRTRRCVGVVPLETYGGLRIYAGAVSTEAHASATVATALLNWPSDARDGGAGGWRRRAARGRRR